MDFKRKINLGLGKLGYTLIRRKSLEELIDSSRETAARFGVSHDSSPADAQEMSLAGSPREAGANLRLIPASNTPPRTCTALAPKFEMDEQRCRLSHNIIEFQQKGITVIATSSGDAAHWRETEKFDRDFGNAHSAWDWAGGPISPSSSVIRTGIPSQNLVADLTTLFSGTDYDAFFRGMLGCPIMIGNCRLVKSLPHVGKGVGPQSWHRDGSPAGVIRGVLYLTDVDHDAGPFQYKDDAGAEHTVLGKTGDLLVFDAMRLEHRAMPPECRERAAVDLVFMPRLPGREFRIIIGGMNHWPADPFFFAVPTDKTALHSSFCSTDAPQPQLPA